MDEVLNKAWSKQTAEAPSKARRGALLRRVARRVVAGVDMLAAVRRADIARVMICWGEFKR